jgi:DNA-directed RNA polymerase specialized sigma24 family protein
METEQKVSVDALDDCMNLIENHARVCFKKLRKPAEFDLDDLISEGVAVYFASVKHFNRRQRKAAFKTYFITALRNRFGHLVFHSYRYNKVDATDRSDHDHDPYLYNKSMIIGPDKYAEILEIIETRFTQKEQRFICRLLNPSMAISKRLMRSRNRTDIMNSGSGLSNSEIRSIKSELRSLLT